MLEDNALRPGKGLSADCGVRVRRRTSQHRTTLRRAGINVGANQLGQSYRSFDVKLAGSLLQHIESRQRIGRIHQRHLDHVRR